MKRILTVCVVFFFAVIMGAIAAEVNPWANGNYRADTKITAQEGRFDTVSLFQGLSLAGSAPAIVRQGYSGTTGDNILTDVAGSQVTLPDGWLSPPGKALKFAACGNVAAGNDTWSIKLYVEDSPAATLTTTNGAAGWWDAEFTLVGTGAATQKIVGKLVAEGGSEVHCVYADGDQDTTTAGAIPVKLQVQAANEADEITVEYVRVEAWDKPEQ